MNKKILIGTSSFAAINAAPMERLRREGFVVVNNPYGRKLTKEELIDLLPGVTGLIAGLETVDRSVMQQSNLRVISRCGVGMSNVDLNAARDLGIKVRYTPDAPTGAVAELTLGAMLSLVRMIPHMDQELHKGRWTKKIGIQLAGKTVAIIGFGRIGRMVASLLKPFDVRIIVVDPFFDESDSDFATCSLNEALSQADIISLHNSGDECMLGNRELELVKPGVFLLNSARGALIDEKALIVALKDGRVAGAWLDTFADEPYYGELTEYPQVILTPHVGSYTRECRLKMEMEAVENIIEVLKAAGCE